MVPFSLTKKPYWYHWLETAVIYADNPEVDLEGDDGNPHKGSQSYHNVLDFHV